MDDKRVNVGVIHGPGVSNALGKAMDSIRYMGMYTNSVSAMSRSEPKKCTRAKGNTGKYGKKCKHGGSCDGYKSHCKFATY